MFYKTVAPLFPSEGGSHGKQGPKESSLASPGYGMSDRHEAIEVPEEPKARRQSEFPSGARFVQSGGTGNYSGKNMPTATPCRAPERVPAI